MEGWFSDGACDGFILPPTLMPGTFEDVARVATPELQRRSCRAGVAAPGPAAGTLRDNLRTP